MHLFPSRLFIFLLTPLREGRRDVSVTMVYALAISTHAPAGGATKSRMLSLPSASNFYSRPCGRGDQLFWRLQIVLHRFLLTPLREGRQDEIAGLRCGFIISTHAPAGGATGTAKVRRQPWQKFLLTPLREGRRDIIRHCIAADHHFYSRPCGRGDLYGSERA